MILGIYEMEQLNEILLAGAFAEKNTFKAFQY